MPLMLLSFVGVDSEGIELVLRSVFEAFVSVLGVFGTVLEGEEVIHSIEKLGTYSGTPTKKISIVDAGEITKVNIANE